MPRDPQLSSEYAERSIYESCLSSIVDPGTTSLSCASTAWRQVAALGLAIGRLRAARVIRPPSNPVFVASTGGHLEQLFLLAEKWGCLGQGRPWLTFDNEQSRSLLEHENVTYIPYVKPRDIWGTYASVAPIARAIRSHHVEDVVSTGAAVAISAAIAAEVTRKNLVYIESIARVKNLSLTGRLVQLLPNVERYVQHDELKARRFHFAGSAMDTFRVVQSKGPAPVRKAFVTVGTIKPYKFERLFTRVQEQFPQLSISWQTGPADIARLPGKVRRSMSRAELLREMQEADVVITHAGVGSILSALRVGKVPVVVPRRARYHEHIDDHQIEIANLLGNLGLVVVREVDTLDLASLFYAAQHQVRTDCKSGIAA